MIKCINIGFKGAKQNSRERRQRQKNGPNRQPCQSALERMRVAAAAGGTAEKMGGIR